MCVSDLPNLEVDGGTYTCDTWAQKAFYNQPTPWNCSNSKFLIDLWATRYGCCGPDKQSSCYVDVGAAVCKDGSSCTLYRCRRYSLAGASFLFPFSFLHYFSLSLVYLFDLFDLIMHYRHLASSSPHSHTHTTVSIFFHSETMSLFFHFSHFSFSRSPPLSPFPQTLEATHLVVVNLHAIHGGLMQLTARDPLARTRKVQASLI